MRYRFWINPTTYIDFSPEEPAEPVIELDYGAQLGTGTYGVVYEAKYRVTQAGQPPLVIKQMELINQEYDTTEIECRSFEIMYGIKPQIYRQQQANGTFTYRMLMLYLPGVSLAKYLSTQKPNYVERLKILIAILNAVKAMHGKGICHGDLKTENINITKDPSTGAYGISILDFGMSYPLSGQATTFSEDCEYWSRDRVVPEGNPGPAAHPYQDIFSLIYYLLFFEQGFSYQFLEAALPPISELQEEENPCSKNNK